MSAVLAAKMLHWRGLKPGERVVLLVLADEVRLKHLRPDGGMCWPSIARIADRCELARRQVQRHLQRLADHGCIAMQRGGGIRQGDTRHGIPTKYFVKLPPDLCGGNLGDDPAEDEGRDAEETVSPTTPFADAETVSSKTGKGVMDDAKGCHRARRRLGRCSRRGR